MAKRRKTAKRIEFGGMRIPRPLLRGLRDFASTPLGQALIAEALIATAHALSRRHPVAAAENVAAGAAAGAKTLGATLSEAAAKFLHVSADLLKSGKHAATSAKREADKPEAHAAREGNGAASIWDEFDEETIRRALLAALGQGKPNGKKKKRQAAA